MTGSVRSLYTADAATAIHEMIFRRLGLNLDPAFFTTSFDHAAGTVTLQALAQGADGTRSPYSGSVTYPLSKLVLERQVPPLLTWSGSFPPTVDELADYLLITHGFYLEDGDFYGNGDRDAVPLTRGMTFTGVLDPVYQTFQLIATDGSPRWAVNSTLTFQQVQSLSRVPLDGMAVTNSAPDGGVDQAYNFSYSVENGVAPYSFSVVEGSTPAPLASDGTMQASALAAPGDYDWTVKTTDAEGRALYVQDSAQVSILPLTMNNAVSAMSVQVADPINIALGTTGGKKPYSYSSTLPGSLKIVNDQLVGALEGALAKGTTSITVAGTVTVTDALGSQTTRSFSFTVNDRATTDVQVALRAKVVHWYELCEPSGTSYTDNVAGDTYLGIRSDVITDTLNRSNLTVSGLSNSLWNQTSVGTPWTNYFAYVQDFNYNSGRPGHAQALAPDPVELFSDNLSVWLVFKRRTGSGVQHLLGYGAEANGGWAVKVDQTSGELVLAVVKDGVAQECRFGPISANEWGSHFLQVADNLPEWCHNTGTPTYGTPFTGTLTPNLQDPIALAIAPSGDPTTHYTGQMGTVAVFNDRLWSDERKWLENYTPGSAYFQPQLFQYLGYFPTPTVGAAVAVAGLNGSNGYDFTAVVGESFALEWPISGGNGYYFAPQLFTPPAGVTVDIRDGNVLRLSGTASATLAKQGFYPAVHSGDRPDASGFTTQYSLTINDPLTVTGTFPAATAGTAYDQSLSVTGGTNVRKVTLAAGSLPTGLSLFGAGQYYTDGVPRLKGTPTAGGSFSFTLHVQTNDGQAVDVVQSIAVTVPDPVNYPALSELVQSLAPADYWRLGEVSGTTAQDTMNVLPLAYVSAGVTYQQAALVPGDPTAAAGTDGSMGIAETTVPATYLGNSFSVFMLVQPNVGEYGTFFHFGDQQQAGGEGVYCGYTSSGEVYVSFRTTTNSIMVSNSSNGVVSAHTPARVVLVFKNDTGYGVTLTMYVNSVAVISFTTELQGLFYQAPSASTFLTLGARRSGSGGFNNTMVGALGDVAVWNRELTAAEVAHLEAAATGQLHFVGHFDPTATVGQAYDSSILIGGGRGTYDTVGYVSTPPPDGLALSLSGPYVHLAGTPTYATSSTFQVTASTSGNQSTGQSDDQTVSAVEAAPPPSPTFYDAFNASAGNGVFAFEFDHNTNNLINSAYNPSVSGTIRWGGNDPAPAGYSTIITDYTVLGSMSTAAMVQGNNPRTLVAVTRISSTSFTSGGTMIYKGGSSSGASGYYDGFGLGCVTGPSLRVDLSVDVFDVPIPAKYVNQWVILILDHEPGVGQHLYIAGVGDTDFTLLLSTNQPVLNTLRAGASTSGNYLFEWNSVQRFLGTVAFLGMKDAVFTAANRKRFLVPTDTLRTVKWDAYRLGTYVSLAANGLTVTHSSNSGTQQSASATRSRLAQTANHYFEVTYDVLTSNRVVFVGVARENDSVAYSGNDGPGQTGGSFGYRGNGGIKTSGNSGSSYGPEYFQGDTIGVLLKNGKLYFRKNGTWIGDPVAETGYAFSGLTGEYFPSASLIQGYDQFTGRFAASDLRGSLPAGTKVWGQD